MYALHLRLSKLLGVEICEDEFNGKVVPFIKFPMDVNGVYITDQDKKIICWDMTMSEKAPNPYGQSHYISLSIRNKDIRQMYIENGWTDMMRFFGTARNLGNKRMTYNTTNKRFEKKENHTFDNMDKEE